MRKSTRLLKRFAALFLVVLMSIESFAAVVSDNDGSAFITKAEFDSVKNEFQKELGTYTENIDNKLEGAISTYLRDVKNSYEPSNLYNEYIKTVGAKPKIRNTWSTGSSSVTAARYVSTTMSMVASVVSNLSFHIAFMRQPSCYIHNSIYGSVGNYHAAVICGTPTNYDPSVGWSGDSPKRNISNSQNFANPRHSDWSVRNLSPSLSFQASNGKESYSTKTTSNTSTTATTGSGSAWLYQIINGIKCLKYYCSDYYPQYDVSISASKYAKFTLSQTNYFNSTGKSISTSGASWTTRSVTAELGKTNKQGDSGHATSSSQTKNYAEVSTSVVKTTDGTNYLNDIFAITSNASVYAYDEDYTGGGSASSYTSISGSDLVWYDEYYGGMGSNMQTNTLGKATAQVKFLNWAPSVTYLAQCGNYNFSAVADTKVYHGNGVPLARINDENKKYAVKINIGCSTSNPNIALKISNKPFNLGNFSSGAKSYLNTTITKGVKNYTLTIPDKDALLWVWVKNQSNNDILTIESFEIKLSNS